MSIEQILAKIKEYKYRQPFLPFYLEMTDGRSILVDDPDAIGYGGTAIGYVAPNEVHLLDGEQVVSVRLAHEKMAS